MFDAVFGFSLCFRFHSGLAEVFGTVLMFGRFVCFVLFGFALVEVLRLLEIFELICCLCKMEFGDY